MRSTTTRRRKTSCTDKILFKHWIDAEQAAREYKQRILFSDMAAYRCSRHSGWHIGHPNKRTSAREQMRWNIVWFDGLVARCAAVRHGNREPLEVSRRPVRTPFSKCQSSEGVSNGTGK